MTYLTLRREGDFTDQNMADALLTRRGADLLEYFIDAMISTHDGGRVLIGRLPPRRAMERVFGSMRSIRRKLPPELWRVMELASGPGSVTIIVERWDGEQWRQFYFSPEPESLPAAERVSVLVDCLRVAGMIEADEEE